MNGEWRAETQLADHGSAGWGIKIIIVVRQRTQPRELFFVALPRYSRRSDGIFVFTALLCRVFLGGFPKETSITVQFKRFIQGTQRTV